MVRGTLCRVLCPGDATDDDSWSGVSLGCMMQSHRCHGAGRRCSGNATCYDVEPVRRDKIGDQRGRTLW